MAHPPRSLGPLALLCALATPRAALASAPTTSPTPEPSAKAGPWFVDLSGGFALGPDDIGPSFGHPQVEHQLALALVGGFSPFADRSGYVLLSPQLQHGSIATMLTLTAGFQYDLPLSFLPRGFFLSPRLLGGYTSVEQKYATAHSLTMIPSLGLTYVAARRVRFTLEPASVAVYQIGEVAAEYRVRFLGGVGACF